MMEIFVTCAMACCTHVFSYDSQWLDVDDVSLKSAKDRCVVHYPASPCLVKFVKKEEQDYWVTCGKDNVK